METTNTELNTELFAEFLSIKVKIWQVNKTLELWLNYFGAFVNRHSSFWFPLGEYFGAFFYIFGTLISALGPRPL